MVIVLFFDDKYFHFATPLLESIAIHEPKAKLHIHAFNLRSNQIKILQKVKNFSIIQLEHLEFNPDIADEFNKGLNKGKPLRFQLTCQRGRYLLDAMDNFSEEKLFIISDVDTLMINPFYELKQDMKKHDVGVVRLSKEKICGGFFAVNNNKNGRLYLKMFHENVMTGRLFVGKDQKTLAKVCEETKHKIKFLSIDRRYLDHTCKNDSFMWSAHKSIYGSKKDKYKTYIKKLTEMKQ